ncbi:MAG: hypothetical protein AUJ49_05805 [Desulfovibrionaceae bacterium CG1_02_65_16]|nr:MAG: hypothetical protein AUJ49_05805 [Desulfovibrionaceae bacterium CG1_02_65_16]
MLLHDKSVSPERCLGELSRVLRNVGFLVVMPEMPWSPKRGFDATFQQALVEIGMAAEGLRVDGCTRIALVGHGLGANAALAFAAHREGVFAVAALAPAHDPVLHREVFLPDVRKARSMLTVGGGSKRSLFTDFNADRDYDLSTTAEVYLSYNDPDGDAVMPKSCAALKNSVPLLWVVGQQDPLRFLGESYAFDKAPRNPASAYETVPGDHFAMPRYAARHVAQWLRGLMTAAGQ